MNNLLPNLPIPVLDHTKKELINWITPLVDDKELTVTHEAINSFFTHTNEADLLQKKLIEWQNTYPKNWLAPLWDELYLNYRGKLHTDMNFNMILDNQTYQKTDTIEDFAARFIRITTEFYHLIIDEDLVNLNLINTKTCLKQYKNLFSSLRVPGDLTDTLNTKKMSKKNNFILISYQGLFYKLNVSNQKGIIFNEAELKQAVREIMTQSEINDINIGLMTTANRDNTVELYEELKINNSVNFSVINDALIILHFDLDSAHSESALERLFIHASDKYYDKTIQAVITKDQQIGLNVEHTGADATTVLTYVDYLTDKLTSYLAPTQFSSGTSASKLHWEISDETQTKLLELKQENMIDRMNYTVDYLVIDDLNTNIIKELTFSPDAFFHIALQLAQFEIFGEIKSTYEAVAMRSYNEGRTECVRPSTSEHRKLAEMWNNPELPKSEILKQMNKAANEHKRRIKLCISGNGIERHLYGLEAMYHRFNQDLNLSKKPDIFTSPGYLKLKSDFLSTTNISHPMVKHFIFGPVNQDGYGIYYNLLDDKLILNISSTIQKQKYARKLLSSFDRIIHEMSVIAQNKI